MKSLNPLTGPAPFPLSGTFSVNLNDRRPYGNEVVRSGDRWQAQCPGHARGSIGEAIKIADVPACVTSRGSMFRIHISADVPKNYRQAYFSPEKAALLSAFVGHLFDGGLLMVQTGTGCLSTAMSEQDIDDMAAVVRSAAQDQAVPVTRPFAAGFCVFNRRGPEHPGRAHSSQSLGELRNRPSGASSIGRLGYAHQRHRLLK